MDNCHRIPICFSGTEQSASLEEVLLFLVPFWSQRNSHAYGTYWPSFQFPFLENMGVVLYNKGYQMIDFAAVDTRFDTRFEFNEFLFPPPQIQVPICHVNFFYEYKVMLIGNTCT